MGEPSLRRKAFLVARGDDPKTPERASIESVPNPRYAELPDWVRVKLEAPAEALMLRLPDGSEWLIEDETLESVLADVRESRAYFAEQAP